MRSMLDCLRLELEAAITERPSRHGCLSISLKCLDVSDQLSLQSNDPRDLALDFKHLLLRRGSEVTQLVAASHDGSAPTSVRYLKRTFTTMVVGIAAI